jgi:hypothetical protein
MSEEFHPIYKGLFGHADSYEVEDAVRDWVTNKTLILDSVAQAIASYWHSPDSPQSTILSTQGVVTYEMTREDFASDAEYAALEFDCDKQELDALEAYIADVKRHHTPSGDVHHCSCCGELVYALPWQKCMTCEDDGCDCVR